MWALEASRRNRLLVRLLYSAGLRPSELCALCWRDVQERAAAGQLIIVGKGARSCFGRPMRLTSYQETAARPVPT